MNPHFFGESNHPLFGVYHPVRSRGTRRPAVLLCPPVGHEYLRAHWAMRMLADRLARQGHPVMRFDYEGLGDSAGKLADVLALQMWVKNVGAAARDLLDESGSDTLLIVGLRFGAAIAALAVMDGLRVQRAVFWDPTWSGEEYLADLRAMHATMLDVWVCPMATENSSDREEILGSVYARSLLRDIQQVDLAAIIDSMSIVPAVVEASGSLRANGATKSISHPDAADWGDLRSIETAWLPSATPALIVEALQPPPQGPASTSIPLKGVPDVQLPAHQPHPPIGSDS